MSVGNFWQLFSSQGGVTRIVPFVSPVLEITRKITGKAKKRNMCVSGYISKKIRVVIFPEFNKKHNKCIACPKYIMKRGQFGTVTLVLTKNMTTK